MPDFTEKAVVQMRPTLAGSEGEKERRARGISFSEVGRSGIRRYGGQIYEEFLVNLRGLQGIRVYREMRDNDCIIGAAMFAIEQVIERATWSIRPSGNTALDKEASAFLKSCMHDMEHTWQDFISEVLSFLTYGWVWMEVTYKLRKGISNNLKTSSKENDGSVGWRKISRRVQSSFYEWVYDEESGMLAAFSQMAPPDYKVRTIPLAKSLHFRTKLDGDNPEGRSILRNTYRSWFFKKHLEEIEAIGMERDLVGLPVFTPPEGFDIDSDENASTRAAVSKLIANLRRDEQDGIMLPAGWTLELLQGGASRRQFDTDRIINRYDKRIAATVLAQFIMLGMDRVGSFALSRNQNDLFLVAVQSILTKIAAHINNVEIPRLFGYNPRFSSLGSKLPQLVSGKVTDPNLDELSNYIMRLAGKGFMLPKKHIVEELENLAGVSSHDVERIGDIEDEDVGGEELVDSPFYGPPAKQEPSETEAPKKKPSSSTNTEKED